MPTGQAPRPTPPDFRGTTVGKESVSGTPVKGKAFPSLWDSVLDLKPRVGGVHCLCSFPVVTGTFVAFY